MVIDITKHFDTGHKVGFWEAWTCAFVLLEKCCEVTETVAVVDRVREMTVEKLCKYSEYVFFDQFLFLS